MIARQLCKGDRSWTAALPSRPETAAAYCFPADGIRTSASVQDNSERFAKPTVFGHRH